MWIKVQYKKENNIVSEWFIVFKSAYWERRFTNENGIGSFEKTGIGGRISCPKGSYRDQ